MDPSNQEPLPSRSPPAMRPTLLTPGSTGAAGAGSPTRMLASLERDAQARAGGSGGARRFGKARGLALLAVALLAGAGAYVVFAPADDASVRLAAASPTRGATTPASLAAVSATGAAAPAAMAASAPAPVSAQIESASPTLPLPRSAAASLTAASAATTAQPVLAQSNAESSLAPKPSASAPGSRGRKALPKESGGKPSTATVASTKGGPVRAEPAPVRPARRDDEDADTALVAAMIARLDRRGATPGPAAPAVARKHDGPALVEALRQCESKSDPLDARRCRNRACDTHWGKADACPSARAPRGSVGSGVERSKPA